MLTINPKSNASTRFRHSRVLDVDVLASNTSTPYSDDNFIFSVDVKSLHAEVHLILKYPFANSAKIVARALSFSLGISLPELSEIRNFRPIDGYSAKFLLGDSIFTRYTFCPAEDLPRALQYLSHVPYSSYRGKRPVDIFSPLKVNMIPSLHAWIAKELYFDSGEGTVTNKDFLQSQGLVYPPSYFFQFVEEFDHASLIMNAEKAHRRLIRRLEKECEIDDGVTEQSSYFLSLIVEQKIHSLSLRSVMETVSCKKLAAQLIVNKFSKILDSENRPINPIEQLA